MGIVLSTMFVMLVGTHSIQFPTASKPNAQTSMNYLPLQLPNPKNDPTKYCYEVFCWCYTVVWITLFGGIVVSQCYEYFTAWSYILVCGGLALPLVLQPIIYPQAWPAKLDNKLLRNPDVERPLLERYSTKATVYLLTYSFIGNYWYTHYFYSVLKAKYTMPAHRLNDVPIAMFLATHFYFCTYHVCVSNSILRYVEKQYTQTWRRKLLFWYTVLFLSYFTAFMETLSISSFPYYHIPLTIELWHMFGGLHFMAYILL